MRLLVVGSGGREHALAWKLGTSPRVTHKIAVPGNDGFGPDWERWSLEDFGGDYALLAYRAKEAGVELAVIGPDNALADGVVDAFEKVGIACFGPTRAAAKIESSKVFAKEVMKAAGVPTAKYFSVSSLDEAKKILKSVPWPKGGGWVVKADGLALGKGVRVCSTFEEASSAAADLFAISANLLIEEKLNGEEVSWHAFCDGTRCATLEPARDHKTLREGGEGPNTGGMGAFSPVPGIPASWQSRIREQVFIPVLKEMNRRGTPFKGVLYAGLMCDFANDRFWVLEFNARFGDPEAQVLLARMEGDLVNWCEAVAQGDISQLPARVAFRNESAVVVVGASRGYPEKPEKGQPIQGLEPVKQTKDPSAPPKFFVAGARRGKDGRFVTSGGRVFGAMGMGATLGTAREQAYRNMTEVLFDGIQFRHDIALGAGG